MGSTCGWGAGEELRSTNCLNFDVIRWDVPASFLHSVGFFFFFWGGGGSSAHPGNEAGA